MTNKKIPMATGFLFSSGLLLGACGNDEEVNEPITEEAIDYEGVEEANPGGGLENENIGGEVFGFTDFELEVEHADQGDLLKATYEEDRDQVEAEFENSDSTLEGDEAFDTLEPYLAELELNADMGNDEVIAHIIEVFDIAPDYESIELDVTYQDGTDKEYEAAAE